MGSIKDSHSVPAAAHLRQQQRNAVVALKLFSFASDDEELGRSEEEDLPLCQRQCSDELTRRRSVERFWYLTAFK